MAVLVYKDKKIYNSPQESSNGFYGVDYIEKEYFSNYITGEGGIESNYSFPIDYDNNLIPYMTSNTAPSGIADASSSYASSSNYYPFRAMDGIFSANNCYGWAAGNNDVGCWISYEWGDDKEVTFTKLWIQTYNDAGNYIPTDQQRTVTIEGLTNLDVWENCLDTGSQITLDFISRTPTNYFIDLNGQDYKAIRIKDINNNDPWVITNTYACYINAIQVY